MVRVQEKQGRILGIKIRKYFMGKKRISVSNILERSAKMGTEIRLCFSSVVLFVTDQSSFRGEEGRGHDWNRLKVEWEKELEIVWKTLSRHFTFKRNREMGWQRDMQNRKIERYLKICDQIISHIKVSPNPVFHCFTTHHKEVRTKLSSIIWLCLSSDNQTLLSKIKVSVDS